MITPSDLINYDIKRIDFKSLEKQIDNSIIEHHGLYPYEWAQLDKEYSVEVRDIIGKKYKENGWNFVYHRTSSENNDSTGITSFIFSTKEIDYIHNYHKI